MEEIRHQRPVMALLDINLGDQTSVPVALALLAQGVPFALATGYGELASLPEALSKVPVLQKPYTIDDLARVISNLMG